MIDALNHFHFMDAKRRYATFAAIVICVFIYGAINDAVLHRPEGRVAFETFLLALILMVGVPILIDVLRALVDKESLTLQDHISRTVPTASSVNWPQAGEGQVKAEPEASIVRKESISKELASKIKSNRTSPRRIA